MLAKGASVTTARGAKFISRLINRVAQIPIGKIRHMFRNDFIPGGDLLPSQGERLFRDRLQGIYIVKINSFHLIHLGSDITWHCDINNEKRSIKPITEHWFEPVARENWLIGSG